VSRVLVFARAAATSFDIVLTRIEASADIAPGRADASTTTDDARELLTFIVSF
jgi:hypothetical protein